MLQRATDPTPGSEWDWRTHPDRRKSHLSSDWRYAFGGRRRKALGRGPGAGVDHYGPGVLLLILAISVLNVLDAIFTIRLVEAGVAEEWNPLMRILLEDDVQLFANVKVAITSAAVVILVVCSQITILGHRLRVERLLLGMLAAYVLLIGYHLFLLKLVSG